ncbi:serine/threonine-protein kinase mtor [Anaeramoeba ignava]|uniref:non-specific serine/threonine protein kinase n=1 Tax=Anaeramoeba ignava TaxID=1746090 RepID=A0A9Q0LEX9_ANAIG|nr:serine/threonine-protein kinase mtor [Anaeramoeba ignava]
MRVIGDPSLGSTYHETAVQSLVLIFSNLEQDGKQFLPQVMPPLFGVIRKYDSMSKEFVFRQLYKVVNTFKRRVEPYLEQMLGLITEKWTRPLVAQIVLLVEEIALTFPDAISKYLPGLMPRFIHMIKTDRSENLQTTNKILHCMEVFGHSLEMYLQIVVPVVLGVLENENAPADVRVSAADAIRRISRRLDCSDYSAQIIHSVCRVLQPKKIVPHHHLAVYTTTAVENAAMRFLCEIAKQIGDRYKVFLPVVSDILSRSQIINKDHDSIVARLSEEPNIGWPTATDAEILGENILGAVDPRFVDSTPSNRRMITVLKINENNLREAWKVQNCLTKGDWEEWIRKFSTELLRESPSPALRSCATLAQMHHPLARNLFNAAFLGCWLALGEEEQRTLVASLEIALLSPTLPPDILQTLLNLAEFMEHVDRPLPIKIEFFGTLAEKCHAYAKALRYKERQFANDPSGAIGALVTISNKLQQTDAALGIINYSKKHHRIELQESWYEELNQWEDALAVYERKQLEEPLSVPLMVGRMRCLHSLGEWEKLVELSNKASKIADKKMLVTIATLAADAAWVTGNWDQMSLHITAISENTVPGAFLRAVIAVHSNEFVLAQKHIDRAREMLVVSLSALVSESYPRAYSEIVRVQQLSELEEIIEFKKASEGSPRRSMILRAWKKRLKGCEKSIDAWLRILTVRATVLDRKDDVSAWLKFSRICEKNGNPRLAEKTIKSILDLSAEISDSWRGPKNEHSDTNMNINKNIDSLSLSESPPDSLHLSAQKSSLTFISTLTSNSKLNTNLKLNSNTNSNTNTNLNTNLNINTNSNTKSKSKSVVRKTKSVLTSVGLSKPKATPMPAVMSLSMPSQSSMKSWSTSISNSFRAQPLATLRYLEHLWSSNEHNQALSGLRHCLHQISSLANNSTLEPHKLRRLEANAFLTHGKWQLALLDTRTSQHSMSEVLHAFSLSTKADPDWAKPWHYWAFAHFDVVECNNPQPLSPSDETRRKHLIPAINGFFRAIALTSPEKAIRDTLRLLTLWFRYARIPDVKHALKQGFATIPIDTWLQVIPQIIARINTPRRDVNELICYLLVEVGKVHPQSLVYSLTVAEKTAIRHQQQLDNALLLESKDDISPVRSSTISRNSPPNDDTLSEFSDDNEVESPPRMMLSRSKLQNFNELKNNQQDANVDANADVNTNTNSNLSIIINDSDSNSDSNSNSENIHNRTRHRIRTHTTNNASKIMEAIRHHFPHLVEQAQLVSEELIRIVVLWQETAAEFIDEALKMYFEEEDYDQSASLIQQLQDALRKPPETPHERAFVAEYGTDLRFAHAWFAKAQSNNDSNVMTKSWKLFYQVLQKMTDEITAMRTLDLKQVSPKLYAANHLEIAVPGTYKIHSPVVRIESFSQSITVLKTKQRPRKLKLQGSDAFWHQFLLKGHEDLRQDERVMQLLGLVNTLLHHDLPNATRHLLIQRYAVVPLSPSSGLIGWVPHCDTLHDLIREYRDSHDIVPDLELQLMLQMAPDYTKLSLIQKVEVFSSALHSTNGLDLNRILWLKSQNSEVWLDKRTNYTRSLAVMSMVGYILGLGDRHPSNIMMSKFSGKIIHIDFGDCFEVAIHRQIFPERIPFRLTRMLVNAMEVSGIEGTFKSTCKSLLDILRTNKDSLMAMLEAFVYDPLFSWQFVNQQQQPHSKNSTVSPQINTPPNPLEILSSKPPNFSPFNPLDSPRKNSDPSNFFDSSQLDQLGHLQQTEVLNEKALEVLKRVSNKLSGRDFEPNETLDTSEQIKRLIDQATSYENLSQCYIGWCPFW